MNIVYACSGCGCSVNAGGIGLLNTYQRNFIHTSWQQARFSSTENSDNELTDIFHTWNISLKYGITNRVSILAIQSFKHNIRRDEKVLSQTGLGDTRLFVHYNVWNTTIEKVQLTTDLGLGVKLPTGQYDRAIHEKNLPENFNTGTGNFAGIAQINMGALIQEWSIYTNGSYQYNYNSPNGYRFGNQFLARSTVYKSIPVGTSSVIASAGIQYEKIQRDQYANDNKVHGTGGNGLYGTFGIGFQSSTWQCNIELLLPGKQSYVDNEMDANIRTNLEFVYFLN